MDAGGHTRFGARYDFEVIRGGEVVDTFSAHNTIPKAALNDVLAVYLDAGSQTSSWYVALFSNDYNMANAPDLVAGQIGVTLTEFTNYSEVSRELINFAVPASQAATNSANVAEFNINSTGGTVYGGFVASTGTKGSNLGLIFSIVKLGAAKTFENGDIVKVTVTVTAAAV